MEVLIAVALVVLIVLVVILLLRGQQREDVSAKLDASLQQQFLNFQTNLHNELGATKAEVANSKDVMANNAIETLKTIKDMGATIQKIVQQQEQTEKLGQSLKDLMQQPKLRGSYGEAILEEMLERILPKGIWEKQYAIDGQERVDAIVKMKDVVIPIDAKFPRSDYCRYLEADSQAARSECWKQYETAVKLQIKSIKEKYIKPEKGTSEFALLFIPSEAMYYETIAEKNFLGQPSTILEFAQENSVTPVSPNTFYAFLQIVITGIRNQDIIKSARLLQERLSILQRSFTAFYKKYEDIGKSVEKASEAYRIGDKHIERYKKELDSTLQLEELPGTAAALPEDLSEPEEAPVL